MIDTLTPIIYLFFMVMIFICGWKISKHFFKIIEQVVIPSLRKKYSVNQRYFIGFVFYVLFTVLFTINHLYLCTILFLVCGFTHIKTWILASRNDKMEKFIIKSNKKILAFVEAYKTETDPIKKDKIEINYDAFMRENLELTKKMLVKYYGKDAIVEVIDNRKDAIGNRYDKNGNAIIKNNVSSNVYSNVSSNVSSEEITSMIESLKKMDEDEKDKKNEGGQVGEGGAKGG